MDGREFEKGMGDEWMELGEGKGERVDGSVEKENGNEWMGEWRRERAMRGLECREGKWR